MGARTLGIAAALGLFAAFSAHADQPAGDIVDQILRTLPPSPAHPAPPPAPPVTSPAPPGPVAPTAGPTSPSPPEPIALTPGPTSPSAPGPVTVAPLPPPSAPASATPPPPKPAAMGPAPATFAPVSPAPVPPIRQSAATGAPNPGDIVAQAQQAPPRSLDSSGRWTGFYLGGNVGYGTTRGGGNETCLNAVTNSSSGCDIINSPALSTSGVFGGGQLGYTMPLSGLNLPLGPNTPPLMIGIEGDIQPTGISGTQNVSGPFNFVGFPGFSCSPCSFKASQQIDWFSSVRGRIGVPVDDFLFYGTGGIMFGSIRASQSLNFLGSPQGNIGTVKRGADGPVFGGGVEVLLPGPFSAKFEGLYYDLGDLKTVGLPVNGAPTNFTDFKTFGFHGALFRAGINMRLGGLGGT